MALFSGVGAVLCADVLLYEDNRGPIRVVEECPNQENVHRDLVLGRHLGCMCVLPPCLFPTRMEFLQFLEVEFLSSLYNTDAPSNVDEVAMVYYNNKLLGQPRLRMLKVFE